MNAFFNNSANTDYFEFNDGDTFASNFAGDYDITEDIYAAYVMGSKLFGDVQFVGGVRVERTDVSSRGYLRNGDDAELVRASGDYTSVLPSLIANWRVGDDWIVRGAVTRALGRPNYDAISPASNYNEEAGEGSLSIGNPGLKARNSWNYDLSIEWYPNDLTLLSAAVFFKDIDNEFVGRSQRFVGTAWKSMPLWQKPGSLGQSTRVS